MGAPLTLKKNWFNPLFFIINELAKDDTIRTILIYGGKSSSKTVSICQFLVKDTYVKASNVIAYRKESNIIPTTLKKSFNLAVSSTRLSPVIEIQDRRYLISNQGDGISEIVLKGLDVEEKAKGIESYKYLYLDELNHFEQAEYEQFDLSLRGIPGQKLFASWNPVDENSWVKKDLVDMYEYEDTEYVLPSPDSYVKRSTCGKAILIKTNYEDNYWITGSPCGTYGYHDANLIAIYEALKLKNYNSYRVNVKGEWGKTTFGGEFWKDFKPEIHVNKVGWDKSLPIWLSCDENVNPYLPWTVWQIKGKHAQQIDEIFMKDPLNRVVHAAAEFKRRYPLGEVAGLFVGGDRTSIKEDTKKEKGENYFTDILKELKDYRPVLKIQSVNPSVVQSGNFINEIYAGNSASGITIGISDKCKLSAYDYAYTLEASDGTILKKTKQNPVTKVPYQEFGHASDCKRYLITHNFANEYLTFINKKKGLGIKALSGI
jgi:phage terminase large subunit